MLREYGEPIAYADGSGFRGAELERVGIEAFIIHPITTCDIRGNVGNNQASFSVMKHIDLAQVKSLTPEEAGRFDKAVKCLKLKIETGAGTDSSEQSSLSGSGNKDVTRQDVMTEGSIFYFQTMNLPLKHDSFIPTPEINDSWFWYHVRCRLLTGSGRMMVGPIRSL